MIEIPALKKGTEYYLDYRRHRGAIAGLTDGDLAPAAPVVAAGAVQTRYQLNNREEVYASELFAPEIRPQDLTLVPAGLGLGAGAAANSTYKRAESEPRSNVLVVATLRGQGAFPRRGSFAFAAKYHEVLYTLNVGGRLGRNQAFTGVSQRVSVMGYIVPFKVEEVPGAPTARAILAPMIAHSGINLTGQRVHGATAAHTPASIMESLSRPSNRNVIGMALQAIPAGKPGDVVLYDTA